MAMNVMDTIVCIRVLSKVLNQRPHITIANTIVVLLVIG